MAGIFDKLHRDPYAPIDQASISSVDEIGNGYDDFGRRIYTSNAGQQKSWGDTALDVATFPAKMATGVGMALTPYDQTGWHVPYAASEPWDAGNRFLQRGGGFENLPTQQSQQDATTLLLTGYGGNATNALARGAVARNALAEGAMKALSDNRPSPVGAAVAGENAPSFTVKHVSPHSFETFDASKIGSGIGANTEGYGFYTTTSDNLINAYADQFENPYRYEIRVNEDPSKFYDWDGMPPFVQDILKTPEGVEYARQVGKVGAVARNTGKGFEGTSNYTLFPHANAEIVHKWGPDGTQIFSDTGRPSLMGSAVAGGQDHNTPWWLQY